MSLEIRKLSNLLSVSGQISLVDMVEIKAHGFGSIICNRPDGEEMGQPDFRDLASAASKSGLQIFYLPISPESVKDTDLAEFNRIIVNSKKPVLAFCRTGTRSATLADRSDLIDYCSSNNTKSA